MKTALRLIAMMMLAALLAACARQTTPEPAPPEPTPPPVEQPPVETDRLDPRDFTDARNLENPDSLLSQRVVYFEFDRSNIRAQFRPVIEAHAQYLRGNPSARIILEGHADERGSREYNLGLGERRGNSVAEAMTANNASSSQIEVVSYGEERPVCRESNEDCWQRNRFVKIEYTAR